MYKLPTRSDIESHPDIILVDKDEASGLDIFCYREATNNIENDPILLQSRGIVFSGNDLVMRTFGYAVEMNDNEEEKLSSLPFSELSFYKAYEGAVLRLYYFKGEWRLSTHRKINAFNSKWSSTKSFGTFFIQALESEYSTNESFRKKIIDKEGMSVFEKFCNSLNQNQQYLFLLRNSYENRIVCTPPRKPGLFHISTYENFEVLNLVDLGLKYPESLGFLSLKDVIEYVKRCDPFSLQGVIAFDKNHKQYKIYNSQYQEYINVRGNEPNLIYRYFEIRTNNNYQKKFLEIYPEYTRKIKLIEDFILSLSRFLSDVYIQRYLKGRYVYVEPEEHSILKRAHESISKQNKYKETLTSKMITFINETKPMTIYRIYRRKKEDK